VDSDPDPAFKTHAVPDLVADPDSGKILTKFSEGKENDFFHLIFLTNIFRPSSLPKL
jgi:hypothetical protein